MFCLYIQTNYLLYFYLNIVFVFIADAGINARLEICRTLQKLHCHMVCRQLPVCQRCPFGRSAPALQLYQHTYIFIQIFVCQVYTLMLPHFDFCFNSLNVILYQQNGGNGGIILFFITILFYINQALNMYLFFFFLIYCCPFLPSFLFLITFFILFLLLVFYLNL